MKRPSIFTAVLCLATLPAATADKPPASPPAGDPLGIVLAFVAALGNADLDGVVDTFAEDATVFLPIADITTAGRLAGRAAIRDGFRPFLDRLRASGKGPPYMVLTPHDISVQKLDEAAAVVTFHLGPLPTMPVERAVSFSRRTFVLRRDKTGWRIVHMHASNVLIEPSGPTDRKQP